MRITLTLSLTLFLCTVVPAAAQPGRTFGCAIGASYEGFHDSASCQTVTGWVWDSNQPTTPLNVDLLVDNAPHTTIPADLFRQDLVDAGKGDGRHGFRYVVPNSLKDGASHAVLVRVAGTTFNLTGTPKSIACAAPQGFFHTIAPCRVVDTRNPDGPLGGPALSAGGSRMLQVGGNCGVPTTANAVAINVTVEAPTAAGHLHFYPDGVAPGAATGISYQTGLTRANNAVLLLGAGGLGVFCEQPSGTVHLVIDVVGYFN